MKAFAPVIGAKPSSGALLGVAGNVAFYRGDPATTRISSMVASLTFSTKGQTALTDRFTMFGATIACGSKPITALSGPRSRRRRSAPAPTPATACSPTSTSSGCTTPPTTSLRPRPLRRRRPVLRQSHQHRSSDDDDDEAVADASGPRHPTCNTATPTDFRSTRRRPPGRAWTCCGTRATASSTPARGWLAKASYRDLVRRFSRRRTRAGSG